MQAVFRTDVVTLAAEDTLGNPDPDPFCLRYKLYRICRTDPDTHFASDTGVPVIEDLPPVLDRCWDGRMDSGLTCSN